MSTNKTSGRDSFFCPYGLLNNDYANMLKNDKVFPADWTGFPGCKKSLREQWIIWRSETLEIITANLWPAWDRNTRSWLGLSKPRMMELTQTDFGLLQHMQQQKPMQLDRQINSSVPGRSTHRDLFKLEDQTAANFGTYFNEYDSELAPLLLRKLPKLIFAGFDAKSLDTDLQIKQVLQRPRAYQVALGLGHEQYFYLPAISADTPSMCSGHCMEGLLAVGAAMERFLLDGEKIADSSWMALEQYAADIGDRRVMAGVHYPSDNLCSWLIVMRLANHVYQLPEIKKRLWTAISTRSFVYQEILRWINARKGKAYQAAFDALQRVAS